MRTQYVCTWTIALWGDTSKQTEETARALAEEIEKRFNSFYRGTDLLQSHILGPILLPREETPYESED